MISIRRRLLVGLLSLFALGWLALAASSYFSARHEIEELFDAQLAQAAQVLLALHSPDHIQDTSPGAAQSPRFGRVLKPAGFHYEEKIAFQIWHGEHSVLRSANAPVVRWAATPGYQDRDIDGQAWRVYSVRGGDLLVQVGEQYYVRNELVYEILWQTLFPIFLTLPLLALLTWNGVNRGLAPLARLARAIRARSPAQLQPIESGAVPIEVRALADALNHLLERLAHAFEGERRFTAHAAHELRTPLAGLKAQAQVALRAHTDSERAHALQQIVVGVDRATRLVSQLLTLARLDPDVASHHYSRVDLNAVARAVAREFEANARGRGVALHIEGAPATIDGDAQALEILVRNLLDNALRHSPVGGRVTVTTQTAPPTLIVADNGPGIPASEREKVFARFYRLQDSGEGCGLGLSIARRIAELHRAELSLDENPGGGLKVTLRLRADVMV